MDQEYVDAVRLELGERLVDRPQDVRLARIIVVQRCIPGADAALCDELYLFPQPWIQGQGISEERLCLPPAIDRRIVQGCDAQVHACAQMLEQLPRALAPAHGPGKALCDARKGGPLA